MIKAYPGTGMLITCLFLFTACSTLNKVRHNDKVETHSVDTSKNVSNTEETTTIKEKSETPYNDPGATIKSEGYYTYMQADTSTFTLEQETEDMRIETTITPETKNGKTKFKVKSTAEKKPKTVNVPIDRETTTTKKGSTTEQKGITTDEKKNNKGVTIKRSGPNPLVSLIMKVLCVVVALGAVVVWFISRKIKL